MKMPSASLAALVLLILSKVVEDDTHFGVVYTLNPRRCGGY
jgi:hypothetical protein